MEFVPLNNTHALRRPIRLLLLAFKLNNEDQ